MPMNTHIIPSINIVVLNVSNTCFQEDTVYMTPKFIIKTHSAFIKVMTLTFTTQFFYFKKNNDSIKTSETFTSRRYQMNVYLL